MKRIRIILVLVSLSILPATFFSQEIVQIQQPGCLAPLVDEVFSCLTECEANGAIVDAGNQLHLYVTYSSNRCNRGQVQNCVSAYNGSRGDCPDAPVMVIKQS